MYTETMHVPVEFTGNEQEVRKQFDFKESGLSGEEFLKRLEKVITVEPALREAILKQKEVRTYSQKDSNGKDKISVLVGDRLVVFVLDNVPTGDGATVSGGAEIAFEPGEKGIKNVHSRSTALYYGTDPNFMQTYNERIAEFDKRSREETDPAKQKQIAKYRDDYILLTKATQTGEGNKKAPQSESLLVRAEREFAKIQGLPESAKQAIEFALSKERK